MYSATKFHKSGVSTAPCRPPRENGRAEAQSAPSEVSDTTDATGITTIMADSSAAGSEVDDSSNTTTVATNTHSTSDITSDACGSEEEGAYSNIDTSSDVGDYDYNNVDDINDSKWWTPIIPVSQMKEEVDLSANRSPPSNSSTIPNLEVASVTRLFLITFSSSILQLRRSSTDPLVNLQTWLNY